MVSNKETKAKITEAFLDIYANSGPKNVTVGRIAKKAGVNRCTFYNYYTGMSELQSEIEDALILDLEKKLTMSLSNHNNSEIHFLFSKFVDSFDSFGNTLYALCNKNNTTGFRKRIKKTFQEHFERIYRNKITSYKLNYISAYAISGAFGMMDYWYESGKSMSTDEFLKLLHNLISTGVSNITE